MCVKIEGKYVLLLLCYSTKWGERKAVFFGSVLKLQILKYQSFIH